MKDIRNRILIIFSMVCMWQLVYVMDVFPELMFPSIKDILKALLTCFIKDEMFKIIIYSLSLIGKGLIIGILSAFLLSSLAVIFKWFYSINNMFIAIFDPLPGIALLPLAILWFGTGESTIIFIIIHSVVWPICRNVIDGFSSVSSMYIEVGKNLGMNKLKIIYKVYLPAAFPYILSGLRVSWARAWRALISAEMIFGVSGSIGGLGWYIFTKRYQLEIDSVFAALIVIIIIGLIVEYGFFSIIERKTIKKWGMIK